VLSFLSLSLLFILFRLQLSQEYIWAIDQLIHAYPSYVKISDLLNLDTDEKRMTLAQALHHKAIVVVK
jgi:hypothetical protein